MWQEGVQFAEGDSHAAGFLASCSARALRTLPREFVTPLSSLSSVLTAGGLLP